MSLLSKIGKFVGRVASNPLVGVAASFVPGGGLASRILTPLATTGRAVAQIAAPAAIAGMGVQLGQSAISAFAPTRSAALPTPPGGFSTGGGFPALPGMARGAMPASGVSGYHYAKDGSGRLVRNRRMNVLNPQAARRAIRRVKGAMKMLKAIERQLPTRTVRRRS